MSSTLVASVLNADLGRLAPVCSELEEAGLQAIQWDVMDGHFVPNLTVGADVIAACRAATALPFEAHLMIDNPDPYLGSYIEAGCEIVIVHAETCTHLHRTLSNIRDLDGKAGVALNPSTPLEAVAHVLDLCDLVLVMTVNPGFGGQSYISAMEPKIARLRDLVNGLDHEIEIEVDGGISPATVAGPAVAGANRFVVGSALYKKDTAEVVSDLKKSLDPIGVPA